MAMSAALSTTGVQTQLKAMSPADNQTPSPMLQALAFLMARDNNGSGLYTRLNCDGSGRLKTLFGANIGLRYRTPKGSFEEQGGFTYGIALNRIIVTNSSASVLYLYMSDQTAAIANGEGSDFPIIAVPAASHFAIEWLYPITTSYGLRFGLSTTLHTAGVPDYRGAGAVAKWLVECSS